MFYADDTVIYYLSRKPGNINDTLNSDLAIVSNWLNQNLLALNTSKCKFMLFGSPKFMLFVAYKGINKLIDYDFNFTSNAMLRVYDTPSSLC